MPGPSLHRIPGPSVWHSEPSLLPLNSLSSALQPATAVRLTFPGCWSGPHTDRKASAFTPAGPPAQEEVGIQRPLPSGHMSKPDQAYRSCREGDAGSPPPCASLRDSSAQTMWSPPHRSLATPLSPLRLGLHPASQTGRACTSHSAQLLGMGASPTTSTNPSVSTQQIPSKHAAAHVGDSPEG